MPQNNIARPLIFAHLGDLHITNAKEQNYIDLLSITAQLETNCSTLLDFVFLPGDNADNGLEPQYKLVATALKMLSVPVYLIPGDHDVEQGSLQAFYTVPFAKPLPHSISIKNIVCLFLDVSGPGKGGPDFRLGHSQLNWVEEKLSAAKNQHQQVVIFMHTYPADLKDGQEYQKLNQLIAENDVLLVDTGHTHYNELANDGHVIYAATRSTGQIAEGPVGYSIVSITDGYVSWRFKPLADAFPFVLITAPADYRLARDGQPVAGFIPVKAVVFSAVAVKSVICQINGGNWQSMFYHAETSTWNVTLPMPGQLLNTILVEAKDENGRPGRHQVQVTSAGFETPQRFKNGSDADSIGSWFENGIMGTQLGPNRNAP